MKRFLSVCLFVLYGTATVIGIIPVVAQQVPCKPCEDFTALKLPEVRIHTARWISEGDKVEDKKVAKTTYCKVLGVIGKEINFELLLPVQFNGRFAMSGGGGFVSGVSNGLRGLVNDGYATAGTDVGHKRSDPSTWAYHEMERQLNFGHLGIHRTAVVCKYLIETFYGQPAKYHYFVGSSRGGGQAMMEAQRYPEDFDGIVAGAPAFNWTGFAAKFIQIAQQLYPDGLDKGAILGKNHLQLLQKMIMEQCDALDGVRDTILTDPTQCPLMLSTLPLCPNNAPNANCFTAQQLKVIETIYQPLRSNGQLVHAGFPIGGENEAGGWDPWIVASQPPSKHYPSFHTYFGIETFKYLIMHDKEWDYRSYDLQNVADDTRYAAAYLNATSTDYSAFKARGGKMLIWQGWADPAISATDLILHYQEAQKVDSELTDYIRMYLLPGVLHGGGQGPDKANWLGILQDWVEKGIAPEKVIVTKKMKGEVVMSRPVYPYPQQVVYDGKGDPSKETSFRLKPVTD